MWNNSRTIYEILGVNPKATQEEIKIAWRNLVRKYKTNLNKKENEEQSGDEELKTINAAYNIASSPSKRQQYDSEHINPPNFEFFFNTDSSFTPKVKIKPLTLKVTLTLEDLYVGGIKEVKYWYDEICDKSCKYFKPCTFCKGTGYDLSSSFKIQCLYCMGRKGSSLDCYKCDGKGRIKHLDVLKLHIPTYYPEHREVITYQYKERGDKIGTQRGILNVEINIINDNPLIHMISNTDIQYTLELPFYDILLGKDVEISIWKKKIKIKIPPTTFGEVIRLKGLGLKSDLLVGDLYIKLTPEKFTMTEQDKKHLQEIKSNNDERLK